MKIILPVKPISQLFPIPFVMGCEGVSAAMLLQFNNYDIKATQIMSHWPKHPTNPYKGQPVIIYHTSLGSKPLRRVFHFDNQPTKLVSNIHVTLLIGYDDDYYYYIDPLWSRLSKFVIFPSIIPNSKQIIKIKKHTLENSYNAPGKKCIYIDN